MKLKATHGENEIVFTATKCKKPKFKSHRGRTWDSIFTLILTSGEEINPLIDTSWGQAHYFCYDNQWYKISQNQEVLINNKKDTYYSFEDLGYHCHCEITKK